MDVDLPRVQPPFPYEPPTVVGYGRLADLTRDNGLMGGLHFATGTMASLSSPAAGGGSPGSQGVQGSSTSGAPTVPGGAHAVPGASPTTPSSGVAGTQVSHPSPAVGTPGTSPSSGTLAARATGTTGSGSGGSSGRGTLPFTGGDVGAIAALGGLSAILGTALRRVTRRRASES